MKRVVIDTNVFVAAMRSGGGASRQIIRGALNGVYVPLFSNALWLEYEDLLGRDVWTSATTPAEWPLLANGWTYGMAGVRTFRTRATTT